MLLSFNVIVHLKKYSSQILIQIVSNNLCYVVANQQQQPRR